MTSVTSVEKEARLRLEGRDLLINPACQGQRCAVCPKGGVGHTTGLTTESKLKKDSLRNLLRCVWLAHWRPEAQSPAVCVCVRGWGSG